MWPPPKKTPTDDASLSATRRLERPTWLQRCKDFHLLKWWSPENFDLEQHRKSGDGRKATVVTPIRRQVAIERPREADISAVPLVRLWPVWQHVGNVSWSTFVNKLKNHACLIWTATTNLISSLLKSSLNQSVFLHFWQLVELPMFDCIRD